MQRYFVDKKDIDIFILDKDSSHHVKSVMRFNVGEQLEIIFDKELYIGEIMELNDFVKVKVIEKDAISNELELRVTICQSLVKESKMDLVLQKGVELGAYNFLPLVTKNSIIKLDGKDRLKKRERWQNIVKDAARQSKRNIVPEVLEIVSVNDLVNFDYDLKILCTVNEMTRSIKNVLQNNRKCANMIIVVGPEGGFTIDEEEMLIREGFISATLGPRVLRTETTTLTIMSMINYEYME